MEARSTDIAKPSAVVPVAPALVSHCVSPPLEAMPLHLTTADGSVAAGTATGGEPAVPTTRDAAHGSIAAAHTAASSNTAASHTAASSTVTAVESPPHGETALEPLSHDFPATTPAAFPSPSPLLALPGPQGPSLFDVAAFVVTALRRHFGKGFAVAALVVLLVAAYLALAPRSYLSTASLFVRLGRESVTLEPTASLGKTIQVAESREAQINSVLEIISGEQIFSETVRRIGPEVILGTVAMDEAFLEPSVIDLDGTQPVSHTMQPLAADERARPEAETPRDVTATSPGLMADERHRKAVRLLQKKIDLEATKRSNTIWLSCESSDPALAQKVLATYIDAAEQAYLQATRQDGSLELFERRLADVSADYDAASEQLAELKSRVGVASLDGRRKSLQDQLAKVETDRADTQAKLAEAEATVAALTESLRDTEQYEVERTSNMPQDARGQAQTQLAKLQIEESRLLAKYTERHPSVLRLRAAMTKAEAILDDAVAPEQETATTSPVWRSLETRRREQQAAIDAFKAKLVALDATREEFKRRLVELNRTESQITRREEEVRVFSKTQSDYLERLEQARMDDEMALRRMSNLSTAQVPTYEPKAIAPRKRLTAAAGLLFALLCGLGTTLAAESWDRQRDLWSRLEPADLPTDPDVSGESLPT